MFQQPTSRWGEISTVGPFALATALPVVSVLGWPVGLTPSPEYVSFRAFNRQGRLCRLPDMATAPHWDVRRRDFHPHVQQPASLHCRQLTVPPAGSIEDLACSAHSAPSGESPCRAHHKKAAGGRTPGGSRRTRQRTFRQCIEPVLVTVMVSLPFGDDSPSASLHHTSTYPVPIAFNASPP